MAGGALGMLPHHPTPLLDRGPDRDLALRLDGVGERDLTVGSRGLDSGGWEAR
jgi:hypothetical protein